MALEHLFLSLSYDLVFPVNPAFSRVYGFLTASLRFVIAAVIPVQDAADSLDIFS